MKNNIHVFLLLAVWIGFLSCDGDYPKGEFTPIPTITVTDTLSTIENTPVVPAVANNPQINTSFYMGDKGQLYRRNVRFVKTDSSIIINNTEYITMDGDDRSFRAYTLKKEWWSPENVEIIQVNIVSNNEIKVNNRRFFISMPKKVVVPSKPLKQAPPTKKKK